MVTSSEEAQPLLADVQETLTQEVPLVFTNATAFSTFWGESVHGVVPNNSGVLLGNTQLAEES